MAVQRLTPLWILYLKYKKNSDANANRISIECTFTEYRAQDMDFYNTFMALLYPFMEITWKGGHDGG